MTKKQQALWEQYKRANKISLASCYGKPSMEKVVAYRRCHIKCYDMDGFRFRICSHNCMVFTVGWLYPHPETGVIMLHYETAHNTWDFEVPADQL